MDGLYGNRTIQLGVDGHLNSSTAKNERNKGEVDVTMLVGRTLVDNNQNWMVSRFFIINCGKF